MNHETGWSVFPLRVRYQETDQMGVVYHANYLTWFEIGRTEWLRSRGWTYRQIEQKGYMLPVIDVQIKFLLPARYDDAIRIYTRSMDYSNVRLDFEYKIYRIDPYLGDADRELSDLPEEESGKQLLVTGMTKHVWVNGSWKPARIDKELPELLRILPEGRRGGKAVE
ncbi:acyl-CoA thioesterase [Ferviditalea candida]|uniref:Thioesterase family protein n=1 Tax=Ferviditalea candida TaxID=3108399 RepID=A0ABU5ZGV4_9BACL|nr:thioesterase family protein [Paenibacillaceae bacterium T2]